MKNKEVMRISLNKVHPINTLNGVLNQNNLEFAKRTLLFDAFRNHTELVNDRQGYPVNDISDVMLDLDIVVMSLSHYNELTELKAKENEQLS